MQVEEDNVHARLMHTYPEVPDSWYAVACLLFIVVDVIMGVVTVEVWPKGMPVWAPALSVPLPTLYLLPCEFIFAVSTFFRRLYKGSPASGYGTSYLLIISLYSK